MCSKKNDFQIIILILAICHFFYLVSNKCFGQSSAEIDSIYICEKYRSKFELDGEYLQPTRLSNEIKTVSVNVFYCKKFLKNGSVLISAGLTGTYAWGYSTQWYSFGDTLLVSVDYKTSAFGVGPVFQIAPTIIKFKHFSVVGEINGGVIFYDKRFPFGGDFYNFMFRTGPSFVCRLNDRYSLKIGYRWMHVSNGKGNGNQNPYYEAQGISVGLLMIK